MPAVPMPDAATEATLDAARSEAAGDLKGRFPDSMIAPPPPAQPKVTNSITNSVGQNLANAQPAPPPAEPGPDAQAVHDYTPQEPSPDAVPVQDDNTMGRALKESAGQLGSEVRNGVMRAAVATARTLGFAASGINNLVSDGPADKGTQTRDDAIFNFIKDHVDTAYDFWKEDPNNTNPYAKFAGDTAEGVAPMMLGPGAAATMAANSTVEAGKQSVDAGDNTKTAVTLALIHGTAAAGQLAVGFKDPSIVKRIAKWVGAGEVIDSATDALTRYILNNEAYKRVVGQYKEQRGPTGANNLPAPSTFGTEYSDADPRTGDRADAAFDIGQQGINAITQAIFGILHTPKGQTLVKKADPDAKPQAPDMSAEPSTPPPPPVIPAEGAAPGGQDIPPPPAPTLTPAGPTSPVSTGPLPGAKPVTDNLGPKIPDQPSQEPVKDLNAQWRDMNDPKTPRTGVLIPKGVDDSQVAKGVKQATAQNRTLDLDQGTLVLKSKKLADKARAELAAGTDPQQVIGQITGAGDGKRPDQTAVVQGQTPEGAVATETAVAPHEVPGAVADVQAQGKTPVVTTPDAAVARRAKLVAEENGPGDNAVPVSEAADQPRATPSATEPTTEGVGSATSETALKAGDRHIITIAGEEVPVVVAAEPVGNKVGVHTIDDDGRVSKDVRQVPIDMFKKAEAPAPADRRTDTATRKKVSEMTPDETKSALLTDDLTQIPNSRAYEESDKKPTQVMVDANSLKYINDTGGHEAGDHLIKSIAQVLHEESGGSAYRKGGDEFVVQADHQAHADDIMARAKERLGKAAVELKSPDGRKLTVNGIGISHGTGTSLAEADSALQREKLRQEAAGERAARGERPPGLVEEGVPGNESHGATSELGKAAELFDKENTPGPGRKFAGSVSEHAGRVAALGRALLEHLKTAKDLPDDVRAHAEAAGKRVARMDGKSEEALSKGQGVSHKSLDAWAADIKQAIHNIDHPEDVKIPPKVETKAASLAARHAKAKEIAETAAKETVAEKVKAKEAVKVKSAIRDVEDMTKPKVLNAGERTKIGNALKRYLEVSDDELSHAHDNLDRIVRDVYGDDRHAEGQQIIELARDQRADARGDAVPKRMSDTVDDAELQGRHYDADEQSRSDDEVHELQKLYAPGSSLERLTNKLKGTGFWKQFADARDNGRFLSTHKVLDSLSQYAKDDPAMSSLIAKLRAHAPDVPIRPVDQVIHPNTGAYKSGIGLFHVGSDSIQIKIHDLAGRLDDASVNHIHAILHEIAHAATSYELARNPNGKFAQRVNALFEEARARAGDRVAEHYGLENLHEFVAEALTNPHFQEFLRGSDEPDTRGLVQRVVDAVKKLLGINNPKVASLLDRTLHAADFGMKVQGVDGTVKQFMKGMHPDVLQRLRDRGDQRAANDHMPGLDDAIHLMKEEPRALDHEDEFKSVVGPHTTEVARRFRQIVRGGALEAIRRNVRAFTPYDGLVRAALRRGVFGHNESSNPLRNYDELVQQRNAVINRMAHEAEPIVNDQAKLSTADNKKLGQFEIDSTKWGMDPRDTPTNMPKSVTAAKGFQQRWDSMQARWKNLSDAQRDLYGRKVDFNEKAMRANRKAGVNVAIDAFSDKEISKAQRQLLYSVSNPAGFDALIGKGKLIDVGDRNDHLVDALRDLSSTFETEGPYLHLGRHGDHVVQVTPEGTKTFKDQGAAERYAEKIRALSPKSKAKVTQLGGQWQVDYKGEYVSMHNSPAEAEQEVERLRSEGFDVGSATHKILSQDNAPLSSGMQTLVAEASRRMDKYGSDDASKAAKESLTNAFVNLMAARSAYAGSKLARRNVGGVKPEEMARNFATHAQSMAWNTGHMSSVFKLGEAMGKLREAVKDPDQPQAQAHQRGRVYDEMMRRARQEQQQYGSHVPFNSSIAKLGFLNYMTSVSHAMIYLTQNFTTSIPAAMARHGSYKALSAFGDAMKMISGPAFRETYRAVLMNKGHNVDSIQKAVLAAVAKHPRFGKYAEGGENSPLQQLIDRGIVHTSLSNQLATTAKGGNQYVNRVMEWARILPSMADIFNRVSSGVAALELNKGDVYKAGDFVRETHIDYSQDNKPRAYRAVSKVWGGNSVTMFKSYVTGMAHLLYSHVYDAVSGEAEGGRSQALKTVAGMIIGTSLFAGIQKGAGLEPLRAAVYAYNKLAGSNDEYHDFDNMTRRAVHSMVGDSALTDVINGGLPRALGFDMSSRMGLSDLFLHDPPDLLSMDKEAFAKFGFAQLGPIAQELADNVGAFNTAIATGRFDNMGKVLPIKLAHNVFDAYDAGTKGKVSASGAQITQPSVGAAISHLVGFRTAQEAKISEKAETDYNYKQFAGNRNFTLASTWAKLPPDQRSDFFDKQIVPFNEANPGKRVTRSDLMRSLRSIQNTERTAQGLPGRDPVLNELNETDED